MNSLQYCVICLTISVLQQIQKPPYYLRLFQFSEGKPRVQTSKHWRKLGIQPLNPNDSKFVNSARIGLGRIPGTIDTPKPPWPSSEA